MKLLALLSLLSTSIFAVPSCWIDETTDLLKDGSFILMSESYEKIATELSSDFIIEDKLDFINAVVVQAYIDNGETREQAKDRSDLALEKIERKYTDLISECNHVMVPHPAMSGRN